jgi:hypothetical protein
MRLHVFEYIVRQALLTRWRSPHGGAAQAVGRQDG